MGMANYASCWMKRKDLNEGYDDFIDLSISARASKIRRLDADLPPIMEKREPVVAFVPDKQLQAERMSSVLMDVEPVNEAVSFPTLNEERALAVYRPLDAQSVPTFSIAPELIKSLKNHALWPRNPNPVVVEEEYEDKKPSSHHCLAVVPWVPQAPVTTQAMEDSSVSRSRIVEETIMVPKGVIDTLMEVDEDRGLSGYPGVMGQSLQQWQQCMFQQLPQNTSTPIMWS